MKVTNARNCNENENNRGQTDNGYIGAITTRYDNRHGSVIRSKGENALNIHNGVNKSEENNGESIANENLDDGSSITNEKDHYRLTHEKNGNRNATKCADAGAFKKNNTPANEIIRIDVATF